MSGGLHLPLGIAGAASAVPDDPASIALVKIASIFQRVENAVIMHTLLPEQQQAMEQDMAPKPQNMNWVIWLGTHGQNLERGVTALERIADAMEAEVATVKAMAEMERDDDSPIDADDDGLDPEQKDEPSRMKHKAATVTEMSGVFRLESIDRQESAVALTHLDSGAVFFVCYIEDDDSLTEDDINKAFNVSMHVDDDDDWAITSMSAI